MKRNQENKFRLLLPYKLNYSKQNYYFSPNAEDSDVDGECEEYTMTTLGVF